MNNRIPTILLRVEATCPANIAPNPNDSVAKIADAMKTSECRKKEVNGLSVPEDKIIRLRSVFSSEFGPVRALSFESILLLQLGIPVKAGDQIELLSRSLPYNPPPPTSKFESLDQLLRRSLLTETCAFAFTQAFGDDWFEHFVAGWAGDPSGNFAQGFLNQIDAICDRALSDLEVVHRLMLTSSMDHESKEIKTLVQENQRRQKQIEGQLEEMVQRRQFIIRNHQRKPHRSQSIGDNSRNNFGSYRNESIIKTLRPRPNKINGMNERLLNVVAAKDVIDNRIATMNTKHYNHNTASRLPPVMQQFSMQPPPY